MSSVRRHPPRAGQCTACHPSCCNLLLRMGKPTCGKLPISRTLLATGRMGPCKHFIEMETIHR